MPKNIFIVFDGLDGSGKSFMIKKLRDYFSSSYHNLNLLLTHEPTSGKYGKRIRRGLKKEKDPMKNAYRYLALYCKDRAEHLKNIILPFLKKRGSKYNIVLCDRYYHSTFAFQHTQGVPFKKIRERNKNFLKPDMVLIFDIEPPKALERIKNSRKQTDKFEDLTFMKKLRQNFLDLRKMLKNENIKIINAGLSKEKVFEQVKKDVKRLL